MVKLFKLILADPVFSFKREKGRWNQNFQIKHDGADPNNQMGGTVHFLEDH